MVPKPQQHAPCPPLLPRCIAADLAFSPDGRLQTGTEATAA